MLNNQVSDYILLPFKISYSERRYGDCRTKAFKQVLENYGLNYSVQQIFGIGQGLSFAIQQIKFHQIALLGVEGRSFDAELEFCKKCGVNCQEHYIEKNDGISKEIIPFEIEILEWLARGNPVLVQCDVYYMSYLNRVKRSHNERHLVTIIGFDLKKKLLYVVDSLLNEITTVAMEELYYAMFEKQYSLDKRGIWYSIEQQNLHFDDLEYKIHKQSINLLGQRMLSAEGDLNTLSNFIAFIERLTAKGMDGSVNHNKYLEYIVCGNCYIIRQQDELNGSCFRSLYLKYIREVTSCYGNDTEELKRIIEYLEESESVWKTISYRLRYSKDNILSKAHIFIENLKRIYELEKKMAELMLKV